MHAPLGVPERQALEECHAKGVFGKFLGACNDQKLALNMCLRKEHDEDVVESSHQRIDRTTRNREQSKERNRRKEEAWAKLEAERKAAENLKA